MNTRGRTAIAVIRRTRSRNQQVRGPRLRPRETYAPRAVRCVGVELLSALLLAALICASPVGAHIERAGYWPDPAPDASIRPAAGGAVPKPLSLASALRKPAGMTRVVCEPGRTPLEELRASIRRARLHGYRDRPTQDLRKLNPGKARKLLEINRGLRERCKFRSIQAAVDASGNNDRVVIMPGVYTERASRRSPTDDPHCDGLEETNDRRPGPGPLLRLSARMPQRSEPDRGHGPRARAGIGPAATAG